MPVLAQLCVIFGICLVSEGLAAVLPVPIPASVLSMVLLLILLAAKVLKPSHIRESADFLLQHMALFFLPACVSVLQYKEILFENFWVIVGISILTTPVVFFVTGHVVQLTIRLMRKKGEKQK